MKKKKVKNNNNLMERTRAAVAFCNINPNDEEMKMQAFMDLFHPEKAKDRLFMHSLNKSLKERPR